MPVRRRYRGDTLVLETEFTHRRGHGGGDRLPAPAHERDSLLRIVEGRRGRVAMHMDLRIRFDYGAIVPWVRRKREGLLAVGGPDSLRLRTPVETARARVFATVARFEVGAGQRMPFELTWYPSHEPAPPPLDPRQALADTEAWWRQWSARSTLPRSLAGRGHALADHAQGADLRPDRRASWPRRPRRCPSGSGACATGTTASAGCATPPSPCYALMEAATSTRRAPSASGCCARRPGTPAQLQLMYGITGERRLPELELDWLPGLRGLGAGAHRQRRLRAAAARRVRRADGRHAQVLAGEPAGRRRTPGRWSARWWSTWRRSGSEPDEGIWEVRGPQPPLHPLEDDGLGGLRSRGQDHRGAAASRGPVERWRAAARPRSTPRSASRAIDPARGAFVQSYESDLLDASLLMMPLVGFLPVTRPPGAGHHRRHRARAAGRRLRAPLRHARPRSTACRRARGPSCSAPSGWPTTWRCCGRQAGGRARCSSGCWPCATTWACCPRATTSASAGWWATSPRPSPTSA